jgi:hypothetical protein
VQKKRAGGLTLFASFMRLTKGTKNNSQNVLTIMRILFVCTFLFAANLLFSQTPVKWTYTAKKIDDRTYEIHVTAKVQEPWHIYSQGTPDGGPLPTKISFGKNPLVTVSGAAKEKGKLLTKYEDVFGVDVKYFDGNVDFVQVVKLKSRVKTNLNGSVEFMACNDSQCLPPKTEKFSVLLN